MPTTQAPPSHKLKIERTTNGGITFLTLSGILDESFEGQKLAESVRTKKLVLSLRAVRRFASWGMAEWMNFLRATAKHDLYLVECSTYAINQMNLVTGLLGHGKLVSFYSPYRCGRCGEEFETLMLVPLDRVAIRDLADSEKVCATCGGKARMDKYPAAMCAEIAGRAVFDIDDEVVAFLRAQFMYELTADVTRLRAFRRATKGNVYLRLSGNLRLLPAEQLARASEGTTIVDLANITFDPQELAQWRSYVRAALATVTSLQLLDCPPGFLESAVDAEDLQSKVKIRSFVLRYTCPSCNATTTGTVDVAENLEQLTEGAVPTVSCPDCKSELLPDSAAAALLLPRLPARERDPALESFLARARATPATKLEDCLIAPPAKPARPPAAISRGVYIGSALAAAVIGGGALALVLVLDRRSDTSAITGNQARPVVPSPAATFRRPDWIMFDAPSSAFCQDMMNRLSCVGISPYRPTRNAALDDANDAALEELVNAIGLKIADPTYRDSVLSGYSEARAKALSALQAVDTDRTSAAYAAADDVVRKARRRVVEIFQASGGPAVPARRSDWYWEEYAIEKATGTEFLVFVRYDVSLDAVKSLVEKYSATTQISGSAATTAFPGLAWQYADFTGGALLTAVGHPLSDAGIVAQQIVTAVGDQRVVDAGGLARRIEEWKHGSGDLALAVKTGSAAAQVIKIAR